MQETYAKALKGFAAFAEGTNICGPGCFRILRNTFLNSRSGLTAENRNLEDEEVVRDEDGCGRLTPEAVLVMRSQENKRSLPRWSRFRWIYRQIILLCEWKRCRIGRLRK